MSELIEKIKIGNEYLTIQDESLNNGVDEAIETFNNKQNSFQEVKNIRSSVVLNKVSLYFGQSGELIPDEQSLIVGNLYIIFPHV